MNAAVKRLDRDIHNLHVAQKGHDKAVAETKRDTAAEKKALAQIATQQQQLTDGFDQLTTPEDQQAALQKMFALGQKQVQTKDRFDSELAGDKKATAKQTAAEHKWQKQGRKDLKPAEFHLGLHATNVRRHELGLHAVNKVVRPPENLNTVKGCAQFLLHSKNVSFWSGLSTGSDRKNVERLAKGEKAFVPATGGHVTPKLKLMQALCAMAKKGHIQINALTGGVHSPNSNHYHGTAVDLDLSTGNSGMIESTARKFGGVRNFETDHIHLDF